MADYRDLPKPKWEGFFWGKWKIKAEGTADPDDPPGDEWEVMHVVENCLDPDHPEYLMVMVPGVAHWQPLDNFYWGECTAVALPAHLQDKSPSRRPPVAPDPRRKLAHDGSIGPSWPDDPICGD